MRHLDRTQLTALLDRPIFHLIGQVADEMGVECYVVGGYVRDLFLERPSKDIDVVCVGIFAISAVKSNACLSTVRGNESIASR